MEERKRVAVVRLDLHERKGFQVDRLRSFGVSEAKRSGSDAIQLPSRQSVSQSEV